MTDYSMDRAAKLKELRNAAEQAERAIDGHMKFLLVSGLAEEGGGLPLYESSKPLAEARAQIAATLAGLDLDEAINNMEGKPEDLYGSIEGSH